MNNYKVGDEVRYKLVEGRGRPGVGTIVSINGEIATISNLRNLETKDIPLDKITAHYEFKRYVTLGRQLEEANSI